MKIIDFNVAWDLVKEPVITGKTGVESWSAPETRKWTGYNEKCDLWAVGCIVLYMLTGRQPQPTDPGSWAESCSQILDGDQLDHFLKQLLAQDPQVRISSAEAKTHVWIS